MSDLVIRPDDIGTPDVSIKVNVTGGTDGTTFTPSVSDEGVLTWTNNGGLANPAQANILGPKGDAGVSPAVSVAEIDGGHRVTFTDGEGEKSFDVLDGSGGGVSSWNDLTDKPFYEEVEEVYVLAETTATPDEDGQAYITSPLNKTLIEGNTYTVKFNGTEYSCVAQMTSAGDVPMVGLGNIDAVTGAGDTGEPFVFFEVPAELVEAAGGAYAMLMAIDGSASVTVSIVADETVVHHLDNKYLDLYWLPTEMGDVETEFIPAQTTNGNGNLTIQGSDVDLTMFTAGTKVAVYIDGERYESTVAALDNGIFAGNLSLLNADLPDTGEPFIIYTFGEESIQIYVSPAAVHTVAVYVYAYGPNKLPVNFIPNHIPTKDYVDVELRKIEDATQVALQEIEATIPSNLKNGSALHSLRTSGTSEYGDYIIGEFAFSTGHATHALGMGSFTKGRGTIAKGDYSSAEGYETVAAAAYQHVQGMCNVEDTKEKYAHIVGNGSAIVGDGTTLITRSNAHTLDWDGNAWFAGTIYLGGTGQDDTAAVKLDDHINSLIDAKIAAIPSAEEASF